MNHKEIGALGEKYAQEFLLKQGHILLQSNFTTKQGELDIITLAPDKTLTITEVKTDASGQAGHPLSWVNPKKRKQIKKITLQYCQKHSINYSQIQFDIITILLHNHKQPVLTHLPNAFIPSGYNHFL